MVINLRGSLISEKKSRKKLAWLTAYDYPSARLLDEAGIDLILVGDSLGMVVLGHDDTIDVTLEEMIHHLKAVRRGTKRAPVAADLPYGTYQSADQALISAKALVVAGADAVKLEGPHPDIIRKLVENGI